MSPQHQDSTGTLVKPTMLLPSLRSSASRRQSVKNGAFFVFAQTRLRLDISRRGENARECVASSKGESLSELIVCTCDIFRLTAAKEAGATIEIDGKKVALGIPGGKSAATGGGSGGSVPGIPLGRGGTPEDAAGSVLL